MRNVLAIGWNPVLLHAIVAECESESIRLVYHNRAEPLASDLGARFELILVNGVAALSSFRKLRSLLDCEHLTPFVFEPESTPLAELKKYAHEDFSWCPAPLSAGKIRQCLDNCDKLDWRRSQDDAAIKDFNGYLTLFHKSVGHEFQTPVNIIKTSLHLLDHYHDKLTESDRKEQLSFVREGAERLERLINDIRLYAEVSGTKRSSQSTSILINETITSAIPRISERCNVPTERIQFTPSKDDPSIEVDTRLFHEALSRIIANAIENSQDIIQITAKPNIDTFDISVTDRGTGIPETEFESIFVPYTRGGEVDAKQGIGLGLPIARKCMELQGGSVSLISILDHGTTFTLSFPLPVEPNAVQLDSSQL